MLFVHASQHGLAPRSASDELSTLRNDAAVCSPQIIGGSKGSITERPAVKGVRFLARVYVDGKLTGLGTFGTRYKAEAAIKTAEQIKKAASSPTGCGSP
jgi:hypothetical protein